MFKDMAEAAGLSAWYVIKKDWMSTMLETSLPFMVLIPTLMLPGMIQHTPQGISLLEKT